ncbi:MAG: zinc ribbon domain-containing protein [Clostridia bacterium]|nr:zinc ribbon domain-containing protein [Clostridia bacterium]
MKYYTISDTPLAYHNFNRFFVLPVGMLNLIRQIITAFTGSGNIDFYTFFSVSVTLAFLALYVVCFVGFLKWKSYAWYAVMVIIALTPLDCLLILILNILHSPDDIPVSLAKLTLSVLFSILVSIYYEKRKPLFMRDMPVGARYATSAAPGYSGRTGFTYSQSVTPDFERPMRVRYCHRCGTPLPSEESRFCHICGTEVSAPATWADVREN